jgi:hypothetical protein
LDIPLHLLRLQSAAHDLLAGASLLPLVQELAHHVALFRAVRVGIPPDATERFFAMVEQFVRDVEAAPPIEE